MVIINGKCSKPVQLEYGVSQGLVLGPKLNSLYTNTHDQQSARQREQSSLLCWWHTTVPDFSGKVCSIATSSIHQHRGFNAGSTGLYGEQLAQVPFRSDWQTHHCPEGTTLAPVCIKSGDLEAVRNLGVYHMSITCAEVPTFIWEELVLSAATSQQMLPIPWFTLLWYCTWTTATVCCSAYWMCSSAESSKYKIKLRGMCPEHHAKSTSLLYFMTCTAFQSRGA